MCPSCSRSLPPADKDHRFCPYCGAARVLEDPPGSGNQGDLLVIGRDVIGPRSGSIFSYRDPTVPPERIDARKGPFTLEGQPLRDLCASSETPLPERAFYCYQDLAEAWAGVSMGEKSFGATWWQIAVRHTRFFALARGGQLQAIDTRTLEYARTWPFPRWEGATEQIHLRISETLLYSVLPGKGLVGVDVGRGQTVLQHPLSFRNPQVGIAGGEVIVLGDAQQGEQLVERYSLAEGEGPTLAQPHRATLPMPQPQPVPWPDPVRLGSDFVFVAADGKIYRWAAQEEASPQVLWSNPESVSLDRKWIPLNEASLGFVARFPDGSMSLVQVGLDQEQAVLLGAKSLPCLRNAPEGTITAYRGTLYWATHDPEGPVSVYSLPLNQLREAETKLTSFPGTEGARLHSCQMIPWQGEPYVLVHYHIQQQQDFWLVPPSGGKPFQVGGHPHIDDPVRVVWEGGRAWQVHLKEGRIGPLKPTI